jgi:hypothetical protein
VQLKVPRASQRFERAAHFAGALIVIAGAVACARFILGRAPLDVHNIHWLWGDLAQVHIAWSQFVADTQAHWLTSTRLSYPLPLSISLFDPMPLLLLLAKPFAGWVPDGTQYFGYYFMTCMVLQGLFGFLATLRAVRLAADDSGGVAPIWIAVVAGILFASVPYTFYRFQGHTALSSQWVLVLSTWVSLASLDWRRTPWCLANGAVVFLATGLNPYLALMILISNGILTVMAVGRLRLSEVVVRIGVLAVLAGVGLWLFGFMGGAAADSSGYGVYSMNLLGPFDSQGLARLLPIDVPDPTTGQNFEGYTYLGLGLLLLCLSGLVAGVAGHRVHSAFPFVSGLLIALCCTLLAVSATVTFGKHVVEIPLPKAVVFLLSRFRGSGRLFWMAGFWLILASIAACVRRFGVCRTAVLITAVLIVQLVDIRPIATQVRKTLAAGNAIRIEGIPQARFSAVLVFPPWQCDPHGTPIGVRNYEAVGHLAVSLGVPTNNFYAARTPADQMAYHCDSQARLAQIDPRALYLLTDRVFNDHRAPLEATHTCSPLSGDASDVKCVPKDLP